MDMHRSKSVINQFRAFGTDIYHEIVCSSAQEQSARAQLQLIENLYQDYHKRFTRFSNDSELSFFNAHLNEFHAASEPFVHIAKRCVAFHKETEGVFDPRILTMLEQIGYREDFFSIAFPTCSCQPCLCGDDCCGSLESDLQVRGDQMVFRKKMDFSGIVKGYITDKAASLLMLSGWKHFLIDSGGDMVARGVDLKQNPWGIAVEGVPRGSLFMPLTDQAIATSGISRRKWQSGEKRYHHLVHPRQPDHFDWSLRSVTVIAPSCTEADVWAKTLFLMGKERALVYTDTHHLAAIFLDYQGSAVISKSARAIAQLPQPEAGN